MQSQGRANRSAPCERSVPSLPPGVIHETAADQVVAVALLAAGPPLSSRQTSGVPPMNVRAIAMPSLRRNR